MIHGITPSFTECGKIKLGGLEAQERRTAGGRAWRAPMKYEAFVITKTTRDSKGNLVPDDALMNAIGRDVDGKLRAIPIVLHSDEIDDVFPTAYARYAGKRLHCSGDGQYATRWEIAKDGKGHAARTGNNKEVECPCTFLDDRSCKPHGTLHCSIRVPGLAVAGAIHTLRTTSIITIRRVIGSLIQVKKAVGMTQGLPLWLVVQPVITEKGTVYCAHIELRAIDVEAAQRTALDAAKMRASLLCEVDALNRSYKAMLRAPADGGESDDEQEEVSAEFHPEQQAEERPAPLARKFAFSAPATEATVEPPHDPQTGEVEEPTADWSNVGPPPMTDEQIEKALAADYEFSSERGTE